MYAAKEDVLIPALQTGTNHFTVWGGPSVLHSSPSSSGSSDDEGFSILRLCNAAPESQSAL
ncbi:hypothetical protein ZOSMA_119G00180 [Zostera marina]|uniref:Uncharacterized protein n=1 Tax=Zostera marina TaxID=29655 RepID=A0A0K9Q1H2_ZOSMR|nr:hypothetical protein ZOSMA_119G00180 [Zostera marina]